MAGLVGNSGETRLGLGPKGLVAGLDGGLDPRPPSPLVRGDRGDVQSPVGLSRASIQNDAG